jgi:hypothetical protein
MILNFFFSIKLLRQFRGAKKIFRGAKLPKALSKNTVFQNPGRQLPHPLDYFASAPVVN